MADVIKLRKGLNINLKGKASMDVTLQVKQAEEYALVPDAFGYRQRVRHRLAGEIRYMDSLCESAHGTGDIAVPGCGRDTAVHHRFNHLVAALFEGVT